MQELQEFNCLYKELEDVYHEITLKAGLADSVFMVLYTMAELGDGCLQKDVSDMHSISKQTVNSAIKSLESRGYLSLKHGKGREIQLFLTSAGKGLVQKTVVPVIELEQEVFAAMPPEERSMLLSLTRKYVALFREKAERLLSLPDSLS